MTSKYIRTLALLLCAAVAGLASAGSLRRLSASSPASSAASRLDSALRLPAAVSCAVTPPPEANTGEPEPRQL
ncbi:MAG: hypothetical protein ACLVJH_18655 [Faecalibacterium prausnitzii]